MIAMIFLDICLTMDIPCIKVRKNDRSGWKKEINKIRNLSAIS